MKRLNPSSNPTKRGSRSGAFMIIAMICLLLASALLGTLLKMASIERRQIRIESHALQAEWLAESALDRAAAKLSREAAYTGETWTVTEKEWGGSQAGLAVIRVVPGTDSEQKVIEVVAHFPAEDPQSIQRTKRINYSVTQPVKESAVESLKPATAEKSAG